MKIKMFALLLLLPLALPASAKDYHVYYLGGQSNMDGYGVVDELPAELNQPVDGVMIFHGNTQPDNVLTNAGEGSWSVLKPGHGVGFSATSRESRYSNRFGLELTFARTIKKLRPNENIAIIKYSRGGTSLSIEAAGNFGCWDPDFDKGSGKTKGVNQYDHFLATIRNATAVRDIDGDGEDDRLIPAGILWMQGESDGTQTVEIANRYEANLKRMMDLIRAALHTDDLPVVIGRISDSGRDASGKVWRHGEIIRAAQAAFCEKDAAAALVTSTDKYEYSDPWHYDSAGYIDLGKEFAEAMQRVIEKSTKHLTTSTSSAAATAATPAAATP